MADGAAQGEAARRCGAPAAPAVSVDAGSPAYAAGLRTGDLVAAVDGAPVRDIIDWQWLSADDELDVDVVGADGCARRVRLEREPGEPWGIAFDGVVFDGVKTCVNACTFCFMRQLPRGMRPSLSLRDDDFRMSFLTGTFVTLTNMADDDVRRVIEQRLSPLRVSLHAVSPAVRRRLIGRREARGLEVLERLLAAGIEADAQIVLVPDANDGPELTRTLEWAFARPGIANVGIVPLGFTKHQSVFQRSFDDPASARRVLDEVARFQERAMRKRGHAWVFAADEFYVNAYGEDVLAHIPPAAFYEGYPMFEDGIGIVRACADEFRAAVEGGAAQRAAEALDRARLRVRYICGEAMRAYFPALLESSPLAGRLVAFPVENRFFGGNVGVTGLLTGCDIEDAIADALRAVPPDGRADAFCIPDAVFNDDGVTLDDLTVDDIRVQTGARVYVVAGNPLDYMDQITVIAKET